MAWAGMRQPFGLGVSCRKAVSPLRSAAAVHIAVFMTRVGCRVLVGVCTDLESEVGSGFAVGGRLLGGEAAEREGT